MRAGGQGVWERMKRRRLWMFCFTPLNLLGVKATVCFFLRSAANFDEFKLRPVLNYHGIGEASPKILCL